MKRSFTTPTCAQSIVAIAVVGALWLLGAATTAQAQVPFGLSEFDVSFANENGSLDTQAGSHPFAMSTTAHFNAQPTGEGGQEAGEPIKDVFVSELPGFIGATTAVPQCSSADFVTFTPNPKSPGVPVPGCSDASVIGIAEVTLASNISTAPFFQPIYNLTPPTGFVSKIGFYVQGVPVPIELHLTESPPYVIAGGPSNISQLLEVVAAKLTLWGVPADPAHDSVRGDCLKADGGSFGDCPSGVAERPFLTLPRVCRDPLSERYAADSWTHPGVKLLNGLADLTDPNWLTGEAASPKAFGFCARLGFGPEIAAKPTSRAAESASGLEFSLDTKNEGLENPGYEAVTNADVEKTVVTLPPGMTANPSVATGLGVCTRAELAQESPHSSPGEGCPDASKLGTVEVETPLLEGKLLKGSLFLAKPYENPFDALLALYVTIQDEELGISIVQPLKVEPDPVTGQLTTTADNMPQLPFSHFRLHFREGARSPLVTPPTCGTNQVKALLYPSSGGAPVESTSASEVISGVNGGPCPSGGTPPFNPGLVAGTLNNRAGSYSPLYLRISRNDGEQQITGFSAQLPPGLTGKLTGIPSCGETEIQHAREQTGAEAETTPTCPPASMIGHTIAEAGVGTVLAQAPGKLYLGGPFEGAPFSIVSITSAKVGPFDLGAVVVHLPLRIDPLTAQITIPPGPANQVPHIIDGIAIHLRTIRVYVDREDFTINPTNCETMSFGSTVIGGGADPANPANEDPFTATNNFQAADCAGLNFKPSFQVSTSGKTSKANGASLTVKLAYPNAPQGTQANIRKVKVDLPKQLPSRLTTLQKACTAAQFHTNPAGCPAASVVGHARAITPILPVPLEGPAYFVSNGGEAFPNLIMVLQGYGITIDLTGNTFIDKAGVTSSTFPAIPDQPVTSFELVLPEGPHSALAANGNLCTSKLTTPDEFIGQNGAKFTQNTKVTVTGCPKAKVLTRAQKLALALKACHKKPKGAKRKACERQARKKYGPVKRAKKAKRK
jgi:hypothetical protein